jgi:hypothetical protein
MKRSIDSFRTLTVRVWLTVIVLPVLIAVSGCSTTNIYLPGANQSQSTATQRTAQATPKPIPWRDVVSNPASVEVLNMTAVPLGVSTNKPGWIRVPEAFQQNKMIVLMPAATVNGVSDFQVKKAGYVFLACNYDYQGNASGGWQETRWTKDKFTAEGWREVTEPELRGVLVNADNREQIIFLKKLPSGATGRLRCNKYDPPFFIVPAS